MLRFAFLGSIVLHAVLLLIVSIALALLETRQPSGTRSELHQSDSIRQNSHPTTQFLLPDAELTTTPGPTPTATPAETENVAVIRFRLSHLILPTPHISPTPTPTPTATATQVPSATPTPTLTPSPTATATPTLSATPSLTPTPTPTVTPTPTPEPTAIATPSPTPTNTPEATAMPTPRLTVTPAPTLTPEPTVTPTPTNTPEPTATPTPRSTVTPTPTKTPAPTATPSPGPTVTPTPTSKPEPTIIPTPTIRPFAKPLPGRTPAVGKHASDDSTGSPDDPQSAQQLNKGRKGSGISDIHEEDTGEGGPEKSLDVRKAEKEFLNAYLKQLVQRIEKAKHYPRRARRKDREGTVKVEILIDASGEVQHISLQTRSAYRSLDKAALEAIEDARPFPPFPDGVGLRHLKITIPIEYRLRRN